MKFGVIHDLLGILKAHDMGDHNAGGIQFQRTDIFGVTATGNADQKVGVVGFAHGGLCLDHFQSGGAVLGAAPDAVETAHSGDFSSFLTGNIELGGVGDLTVADLFQNAAAADCGFDFSGHIVHPFFVESHKGRDTHNDAYTQFLP